MSNCAPALQSQTLIYTHVLRERHEKEILIGKDDVSSPFDFKQISETLWPGHLYLNCYEKQWGEQE